MCDSEKHQDMNGDYCENRNIYLKEFCQLDKLFLKQNKSSIKEVIENFIKVVVKNCKIINTCLGEKILIKGYKIIKVHYVAKNKRESVLSECFCVPFYVYIPIECTHTMEIYDVIAKVEFSEIDDYTTKCIFVYTSICICVKVREKGKNYCNTDYYHGEIIPESNYVTTDHINFKNDCIKERERYFNRLY